MSEKNGKIGKVNIDDINTVLKADKADSAIDVDGKGKIIVKKNNIVAPSGQVVVSFIGKKLNKQISVVRNRVNLVFEKGTTWESISSKYKVGPETIAWREEDFE
jgi:hypothetical protein